MASHLRTLVPDLKSSKVIHEPVARTTRAEVREFKRIAVDRGLRRLAIVGRGWHLDRLALAAQREYLPSKTPIYSSDEILRSARPRAFVPLLDQWNNLTLHGMSKRESIIQFVNKAPLTDGMIIEIANSIMGTKLFEFWAAKLLNGLTQWR
jgi:uncharacterized SAM-binding protein YcdF (DUF218 family)